MSEPTYNVDLLMQVREKIVNEPEKHRQASWAFAKGDPGKGASCGTSYCVAGWAAVLDGRQLEWVRHGDFFLADRLLAADEDGYQMTISQYAREALALPEPLASHLFGGDNLRSEVLAALDMLIEAGKNGEQVDREAFRACFGY